MTATFLVGDVRDRMAQLDDASFDFILCSPPFLALRSYLPDGHPDKALEIGSEGTPAAFLDVLLALTAEWGRLLAPHGSIAIELGDTYAGSGGAGGDYLSGGWRDGERPFGGSSKHARVHDPAIGPPIQNKDGRTQGGGPGWPLDKSLACIPQLYTVALAYGINPLTGAVSPAGRWRVRNLKPWIRSNPPVGALGDKERPATSYVVVACRARDRWFDLDAVRTAPAPANRRTAKGVDTIARTGKSADRDGNWASLPEQAESAGAPPRDWWHHVDAVLDTELAAHAGYDQRAEQNLTTRSTGIYHAGEEGTSKSRSTEGAFTQGAQGVHLRRALERAGILTTLDALDVSPRGYKGAHYAVWPPELVRLLVDEMCPRRVCCVCGEPSRRITVDRSAFDRQPELAAHIKERREALGITSADINGWFGYKEIAKNWERTDKHGAAIPNPDDWLILADKLSLDRDRFDGLVLGDRRWTESTVEYDGDVGTWESGIAKGKGAHSDKRNHATRLPSREWSDCGHNTWRPGRVLDPFVGSGTTLAVATGMGRDAVGIDIDSRNADLAVERCGMFLTVDQPPRDGDTIRITDDEPGT